MTECWPPQDAVLIVSFEVRGDPKPAGSKNAIPLGKRNAAGEFVPFRAKDGRPLINVRDSSGVPGENWRADIRAACVSALDEAHDLADGPLAVRVTFYGARPKGHCGTGRNAGVLKPSAARFPHESKLADGTKLARALEDALNLLCWKDDRRVVDLWWSRRFGTPGAEVDIFALPLAIAPSLLAEEDEPPLSLLALAGDEPVIMAGDDRERLVCS